MSGANYALLTPGAATMARIDAGRAAQVGGFVFRYLWARHRCIGADVPPTPRRLTILVAQGERAFDSIELEPYKDPPIRLDINHPDFFCAIVLLDDRAMPAEQRRLVGSSFAICGRATAALVRTSHQPRGG